MAQYGGRMSIQSTRIACPPQQVRVKFCLRLNAASTALVSRGCSASPSDCAVSWAPAVSYDSGLSKCTVVTFDQRMLAGQYIRIVICAREACVGDCGIALDGAGVPITNALLGFQLDGVDCVPGLNRVLQDHDGVYGCVGVSCTGACCVVEPDVPDVSNLTPGFQIQVGPLGTTDLFPPIASS